MRRQWKPQFEYPIHLLCACVCTEFICVFVCDFSLRFWADFFRTPFVSVCSRRHKLTQLVKVCPYFPFLFIPFCFLSLHSFVESFARSFVRLVLIMRICGNLYSIPSCVRVTESGSAKSWDAKISSRNTYFWVSNTNREFRKLFAFNLNTNLKYVHADFQIWYGTCILLGLLYLLA